MAGETDPNTNTIVERVELAPAGGENVEVPGAVAPEGDPAETAPEGEPEVPETGPDGKPEAIVQRQPNKPAAVPKEPAPVAGETPRERALRQQIDELRGEKRDAIVKDMTSSTSAAAAPASLPEDKQKILSKYKPGELAALREVLPVLADEMGYAKKDEVTQNVSASIFNSFLDKHPEYLPENDKDGTLYSAFKSEFALYKPPTSGRDFTRLLDKVHRDVFGIQPVTNLPADNAARAKVEVASHAGTAGSVSPSRPTAQRQAAPSGVSREMLKGFSDKELEEMGL